MVKLVLVAAAALIRESSDGLGRRVLLAQRPSGKDMAGLWEFPGGKLEAGETPEAALARELQEELAVRVDEESVLPLAFASHSYSSAVEPFHLLMPLFAVTKWEGEPRGAEGQALAWATAEELDDFEFPPADVPLLPAVCAALRADG